MSNLPRQQLSLIGAVAIGLASMLGAGVFIVFREAFALAGEWLWLSLLLAGLVAALNSASILQLARQVDRPGGVYAYASVYLNDKVAKTAGFAFVIGKIASIAAIGLVFGAYVLPGYQQAIAITLIAVLALINILGIQRTATVAMILASITVLFLALTIATGLIHGQELPPATVSAGKDFEPQIVTAAAIFFFAFAGYARVATLGNEVRNARVNIPLAIAISLLLVLALYGGLAVVLSPVLASSVASNQLPFLVFFSEIGLPFEGVTVVVAAIASAGSMLALLAGVSRTAAEMGADEALPPSLANRNKFGSPWVAELAVAGLAALLVLAGPISWVMSLSSLGVLFYYAIGHLSALAQPVTERMFPRLVSWFGLLLCLILASSAGVMFAAGL
ncbi:APC family permease [Rhodoluna limnophila]|uniref:APC family permease n=1 Tax=Rhodoluna limnophila TaxID=232537 RepID=UPI001106DB54|nr:APC family permease [Rhodoluna limnophila]